jgi:hypothetical protein
MLVEDNKINMLLLKLLSKNILVDPIIHEIADGLRSKTVRIKTKYYFMDTGHEWI